MDDHSGKPVLRLPFLKILLQYPFYFVGLILLLVYLICEKLYLWIKKAILNYRGAGAEDMTKVLDGE